MNKNALTNSFESIKIISDSKESVKCFLRRYKNENQQRQSQYHNGQKKMAVGDLAKGYGVSRTRLNVLLNQKEVSVVSVGRLADALGVDVTDILE